MTATFGKLQGRTLELRAGLNILEAPNETGKSTWCAFLLSMLYGINSRERDRAGFIADKNRYAPWSGAAMSGRMDCRAGQAELTLTRTTRRQTSPMGEFQAVYAGTGDPVPELTGQTCGERLLGVSREVFERSAFIRQAGLPISQDAGLERRIAALITSGEEDTSYTEAAGILKKQLNRRRHNKTGQLPALEAELQETQQQLADLEQLERQLADARAQAEALSARETALAAELTQLDRWEAVRQRQVLAEAETAAVQAERQAALLRQRIEEDRIPGNDAIGRLRGAIVNLETVRKSVNKARAERDEAAKALLRAEAAVQESPFAGQTPEQARNAAEAPPKAHAGRQYLLLPALTACALCILLVFADRLSIPRPWLYSIIGVCLLTVPALTWALYRRSAQRARSAALLKRFGTSDQAEIAALADTYMKLLEARDAAQADASAKSATAEALYASLSSNEQGILLEIRRFAPSAFDISTADGLLRECAVRRKALAEAETAAAKARMRCDLLAQQTPNLPEDAGEPAPPERNRDTVTNQLETVRAGLSAARSNADRLEGRLRAIGDPVVLRSSARHLAEQIDGLEREYGAIRLAIEALDSANTTLQNRFSPALGRRAAEIFRELTDGRYGGVVLDRAFRLSTEPAGEGVYRDAALLSAGAADQLYLAARLAICELVLPEENGVPIVLDDALSNFDDARCAAALRWLKAAAQKRQILLFTCHTREADFFAGDGEVSVQRLTDTVE
ncbi:MAG: AAA family ATPase [Oscillospiraceae bacterium]|nr:AAA family ATPase [Oscillospiraceae bacterium]